MTTSTNGQICLGFVFEDGFEFPWDSDGWDKDIEGWYYKGQLGYKPPFDIYDDKGEYIGGTKPPEEKIEEYYQHYFDFQKANPTPVKLVNYCSCDYPMYILAVPSSVISAHRGYPEKLPMNFSSDGLNELVEFCERFGIEHGEVGWYLSSYWG